MNEAVKKSNSTLFDSFWHLGTPVAVVTFERALTIVDDWLKDRNDRYIVFRDVHGIMRARDDAALNEAHLLADMIVPDGLPIVWAAKLAGYSNIQRICGPDFLPILCEHGVNRGWRHYFYGGTPATVQALCRNLSAKFPGIKIAGSHSPPFRTLSNDENSAECARIRDASPDIVWVGLGTPKQEIWMARQRGKLGGAVALGVGAAFDIHAGSVGRAPLWMQKSGLEWSYRIISEPRRLWLRYFTYGPKYLFLSVGNIFRSRISVRTSE